MSEIGLEPNRSFRSAVRWGLAGAIVGAIAAAGTVLLVRDAAERAGADVLSTTALSLAAAAAVLLGALVGSGVGWLLPLGVRGTGFAVVGAVGAVLVGWVTPMVPAPLMLSAGALAASETRWVRLIAFSGLLFSTASLVAFPLAPRFAGDGSGVAGPAFLVGVASGFVVASVAYARLRPRTAAGPASIDVSGNGQRPN